MWCPQGMEKIDLIQNYFQPSGIKADSRYTDMFDRMLYERVASVFDIRYNASFDIDYFKYVLLGAGYICITNTAKYGLVAQYATIYGYNIYMKPTMASILTHATNGTLEKTDMTIGKDCALLYLKPSRCGIFDIIGYYSFKLALVAGAFDMNIFNSKLAFMTAAKNKSAAQTIKKIYDEVQSGNPAVTFDSSIKNDSLKNDDKCLWETFNKDLKQNFIAPELIEVFEKLLDEFDTEVGIPSVGTDKKERLTVNETEKNDVESVTRLTTWLESLQQGINEANMLYPNLNLSINIREYQTAKVVSNNVNV